MNKKISRYMASPRWQARTAPRTITLGDGCEVEIRPVQLSALMFNGTIPVTLMREAQDIEVGADGQYDMADVMRMLPLIDAVVLAVVIDPPLSRDGEDGTTSLDFLSLDERMLIFQEVNRPATELQSFRGEPDGDAAAASDGEDLRSAAE